MPSARGCLGHHLYFSVPSGATQSSGEPHTVLAVWHQPQCLHCLEGRVPSFSHLVWHHNGNKSVTTWHYPSTLHSVYWPWFLPTLLVSLTSCWHLEPSVTTLQDSHSFPEGQGDGLLLCPELPAGVPAAWAPQQGGDDGLL